MGQIYRLFNMLHTQNLSDGFLLFQFLQSQKKKKKMKPLVQGYIVSELWTLKIQTLYVWFQDCLCSFHGTILLSSRAEGHMISNF